jgi:hypothetical protein
MKRREFITLLGGAAAQRDMVMHAMIAAFLIIVPRQAGLSRCP